MALRCFVGFFGLARALDWTIDSIEANVFAPLNQAGLEVTRAAHFNCPKMLRAPRSGEDGVIYEMADLSRLNLNYHEVEDQLEGNIKIPLHDALNVPMKGEADIGGFTRRNSLYQLYSLKKLSKIFDRMSAIHEYDVVVLLRPDLRYLHPVPVKQILAQLQLTRREKGSRIERGMRFVRRHGREEANIVIPSWHHWGGMNDRFAFATPSAARVYMNRMDLVSTFCAEKAFFHPETLLAYALKRDDVRVAATWTRACRVRSDGSIPLVDVLPLKRRIYTRISQPIRNAIEV